MPMALFAKPTRISRVHDSVWIRPGGRSSFGFSSAATRPSVHFLHSRLPHAPSRSGNCDIRARGAEEGDEPMEGSSAEALDVKVSPGNLPHGIKVAFRHLFTLPIILLIINPLCNFGVAP